MSETYDLAVIGGGFGGYVAAIRASQLGLRTVLVEEAELGGTCLNRGCIPTKALLQSAALLDSIRGGERLGVRTGEVSYDHAAASRFKDSVVTTLRNGVAGLLRKNKVELVRGRGRLDGPGRIAVTPVGAKAPGGGATGKAGPGGFDAEATILATGSRPRSLPGLVPDEKHVLTSNGALTLDRVPRSAIVVGAGAVGVEFASYYRSLGAEVTVVEVADRLVPLEDTQVSAELHQQFTTRGIRCLLGAKLETGSLTHTEGGVAVTATQGGHEVRLDAEILLVATGRAANVEDVGLDGTRIKIERGVVVVDGQSATGEPGVYAVGDVSGGFQLAHKAAHEGVLCAERIAGEDPHLLDPMTIPRTTYCTPQIASIGMSEAEAKAAGRQVSVGVMPFLAIGRALIWGDKRGFCKVVADTGSNDVLGVHLIGHEVTELIAGPALGMLLEATPFELSRAIAPHPTLSEVLGEAAMAVTGQSINF